MPLVDHLHPMWHYDALDCMQCRFTVAGNLELPREGRLFLLCILADVLKYCCDCHNGSLSLQHNGQVGRTQSHSEQVRLGLLAQSVDTDDDYFVNEQ